MDKDFDVEKELEKTENEIPMQEEAQNNWKFVFSTKDENESNQEAKTTKKTGIIRDVLLAIFFILLLYILKG